MKIWEPSKLQYAKISKIKMLLLAVDHFFTITAPGRVGDHAVMVHGVTAYIFSDTDMRFSLG
jgi:hypothetical protein